ncbi:MAG: indolepyruvate ferredoxin oxidoreductase [Spirochaetia bacterium]
MADIVVLGDEAVALGAMDAGISAAYGYPGTPSTEIMEYLIEHSSETKITAQWCANEKTAYETAIGTSFAGKRVLVTMKHVGLNVAADPFINSALLHINGGLVLAVADYPGMHSSQNEQDSRFYANFAKIICLELVDQQEAYDMTRKAFEISEEFYVPVMLRLVTRLSHSRAKIHTSGTVKQKHANKAEDRKNWLLIPALARKGWHHLLGLQEQMLKFSENTPYNSLTVPEEGAELGIITTGLGDNYLRENMDEMSEKPAVLRIGMYPAPVKKIRELVSSVSRLVILEEGFSFIEKMVRGILPADMGISGKIDGTVPLEGELNPENIHPALGLSPLDSLKINTGDLAQRPPQLCKRCPHGDSYVAIKAALEKYEDTIVTADIGCYALGVLPPYEVPETIVCMGSSIGVAKGASESGYTHAIAVIGDSTFLHSGLTPLQLLLQMQQNFYRLIRRN